MKRIFLTGATGTIGSELVPRLLAEPGSTLSLLIRASDDQDLHSRLTEMLAYWGIAPEDPRVAHLQPLRGDISLPDFGLSAANLSALADRTTHIIHCAASVKLNMTLAEARATAVAPTRTMLALGRRCAASGQLRKMDLVSTVGVWGRTPGFMPETRLREVSEFHNTYEAAKSEAEKVIWDEGQGLPITVHRPSMVIGARGTGRVMHFQVFYHLCEFLSGGRTFGIAPPLGETTLDTIPVDWVADAICWASDHPDTAGRIFHLCSGPDRAISLPRLRDTVRDEWCSNGRALPPVRTVGRQALSALIPAVGLFVGAKGRRALRGLPPVLAYLAERQGFSNTDSAKTFAAAGLPVPPVEAYLGPVLRYYLQRRVAASP